MRVKPLILLSCCVNTLPVIANKHHVPFFVRAFCEDRCVPCERGVKSFSHRTASFSRTQERTNAARCISKKNRCVLCRCETGFANNTCLSRRTNHISRCEHAQRDSQKIAKRRKAPNSTSPSERPAQRDNNARNEL